jgi:hypothetical protein
MFGPLLPALQIPTEHEISSIFNYSFMLLFPLFFLMDFLSQKLIHVYGKNVDGSARMRTTWHSGMNNCSGITGQKREPFKHGNAACWFRAHKNILMNSEYNSGWPRSAHNGCAYFGSGELVRRTEWNNRISRARGELDASHAALLSRLWMATLKFSRRKLSLITAIQIKFISLVWLLFHSTQWRHRRNRTHLINSNSVNVTENVCTCPCIQPGNK